MALVFVPGCTALAYARWTGPIGGADAALAGGRYEEALARYADAEARLDRLAGARPLFDGDYRRVVAAQLWILHRLQRYDQIIDKAQRAPEAALPHFWAGCAFFEKARTEPQAESRLAWLTRAEEEFRRAVEANPADWDTKYDFELVTRLAAQLRKEPKTPPNQLMQLLRPQPKPGAKPIKRVG
jgi:tetratricopeptide (TPR) repeat protein